MADVALVNDDGEVCEGGACAAREWWMVRWLGHDAVAVLDGGLGRWLRDELPTTA